MATAPQNPTATMVAAQFVKKYYNMLCAAPLDLHRFYKEESTFLHSEGSRHELPVTGLESIRESIANIGTQGAVVQIDECGSVDSQTTENGGVLIMVTGEIGFGSQTPRHFVQTFLLAHNNNRNYYVHNDIFRFLEPARAAEAPPQEWAPTPGAPVTVEAEMAELSSGVDNGGVAAEEVAMDEEDELAEPETTPQEMPPPYSEPVVPASPAALQPPPSPLPSAALEQPAAALPQQAARPLTPPPASPVAPPPQQPPPQPQAPPPPPAPESPPAPAEPVSWAARLTRTMGAAGAADAAPVAVSIPKAKPPPAKVSPKPVPGWGDAAVGAGAAAAAAGGNGVGWGEQPAAGQEAAPSRMSPPPARVSTAPAGGSGTGNGAPPDRESKSLYVKSVDESMTSDDLREAFGQFGPVHAVAMHAERGFAFVEFKSAEAVRLALTSEKPVMVGNKRLNVEPQRPGGTRGYTDRGGRGGRDSRGRGGSRGGRGGRDGPRGEGDGGRGRGRGGGREGSKDYAPRPPRAKPEAA